MACPKTKMKSNGENDVFLLDQFGEENLEINNYLHGIC
jgi:hypothetical protein